MVTCSICSRPVDTVEEEDGGSPHGCQLYDDSWVCSTLCYSLRMDARDDPHDNWEYTTTERRQITPKRVSCPLPLGNTGGVDMLRTVRLGDSSLPEKRHSVPVSRRFSTRTQSLSEFLAKKSG